MSVRVAVIGAGVVGSAVALAVARRGASVLLLESEREPGLAASGTNSGILHTGFDSVPGELETELILRAAELRGPIFEALGVPVLRCGARLRPVAPGDGVAIAALASNAERNGVAVSLREDGILEVPGEAVTDPVHFNRALAAAAVGHGTRLRTGFEVDRIARRGDGLMLRSTDGDAVECDVAVNCAGLGAARVARLAGDDTFDVYPRKGEFLVFALGDELDRILLPVPEPGTKGVLVFPAVDGHVIAGPTAIDQDDPGDWSVRPEASAEIIAKAARMYPPLAGSDPVFAYAGLRPAGRAANYVIGPSAHEPRMINVAAIRSTGLTASLGIAERVAKLVAAAGVELGAEQELVPGQPAEIRGPWWRRVADYRGAAR